MNYKITLLLLIVLNACQSPKAENFISSTATEEFELIKSSLHHGLLILFPCFPCDAENTKEEFDIIKKATDKGFSVLLMNFNRHLSLTDKEKKSLTTLLEVTIEKNDLNHKNIYIGGFSSGGNVSLMISDHLTKIKSKIQPKGVFIIDSPLDLVGLYRSADKSIARNFSAVAVEEAKWIKAMFDNKYGHPDSTMTSYEEFSPYVKETASLRNLMALKHTKIRLYTEPDTTWWQVNRKAEYEDMNAYFIQNLAENLIKAGYQKTTFVPTKNRGYRSNGDRHPHSWAVADPVDLLNWIAAD